MINQAKWVCIIDVIDCTPTLFLNYIMKAIFEKLAPTIEQI